MFSKLAEKLQKSFNVTFVSQMSVLEKSFAQNISKKKMSTLCFFQRKELYPDSAMGNKLLFLLEKVLSQ